MSVEIKSAVEDFWRARGRGEYFPAAYEDKLALDEAYRIQLALIDRRVAAGERHIGWKVGLWSRLDRCGRPHRRPAHALAGRSARRAGR